jgi:hypothetical protein
MTIKQLGGIFGRNPTFEDVTIEGTLTFDGDIDVNSDLKVAGDIETTGNVIIATSGKGIDFSATSGTGTSELLDDYEEGTWTPTLENVTITYDSQSGKYTKIGRDVFCYGLINVNTIDNTDSSSVAIGGLPFTPSGVWCALSLSNGQGATPLFGSKLTETTGAIISGGFIRPSNVASQYVTAYNVANVIANTNGSFYFAAHYTT